MMQQPVTTNSQNSAAIVEAMPLPVRKQRIELDLRLFENKAEASLGLCASDNILEEMFSQPCLAGVYLEEEVRLAFNQLL